MVCAESDEEGLGELQLMLAKNTEAIARLRLMMENIEVLLAKLSEASQPVQKIKSHPQADRQL